MAQYIKFGDLTDFSSVDVDRVSPLSPRKFNGTISTPTFKLVLPTSPLANGFTDEDHEGDPPLPEADEDALVRESTAGFSNFVTSWFHRVIMLVENLPEEGQYGTRAGGADEGQNTSYTERDIRANDLN